MKKENIWYGSSSAYKMIKHLTIVICLIFLLSACATSLTKRAQLKHDAAQPLTCSKGPDCEAKWDRALIWVQNNSEAAIQIANETIITTRTPQNSSSPVISITKTEAGPGTYAIHFRANCSWILGCTPSVSKLKASFASYIMKSTDLSPLDGSQKAKVQSNQVTVRPRANLGVVTVKTNQAAANKLGMKEPRGTRITYIGPGAAFDSGLRLEDVILKFAEQTINDDQELDSALEKTGLAGTIPVTIWRAGTGELVISVRF
jgi:S1-C subfamily serine protease